MGNLLGYKKKNIKILALIAISSELFKLILLKCLIIDNIRDILYLTKIKSYKECER